MTVQFKESFVRDLRNIKDKGLLTRLRELIELVEQAQHWLIKGNDLQLVQRLGEEACVQQVHGRMFDAARVLVNRQPIIA